MKELTHAEIIELISGAAQIYDVQSREILEALEKAGVLRLVQDELSTLPGDFIKDTYIGIIEVISEDCKNKLNNHRGGDIIYSKMMTKESAEKRLKSGYAEIHSRSNTVPIYRCKFAPQQDKGDV